MARRALVMAMGAHSPDGYLGRLRSKVGSAAEAAIREVKEETGVAIAVEELFGVYSDYHDRYPNGDQAQTIFIAFLGRPLSGSIVADGVETLRAAYVPLAEGPPMFNTQAADILADLQAGRRGVIR